MQSVFGYGSDDGSIWGAVNELHRRAAERLAQPRPAGLSSLAWRATEKTVESADKARKVHADPDAPRAQAEAAAAWVFYHGWVARLFPTPRA